MGRVGRQDLSHRAAAVIANQIDRLDAERIKELQQHLSLCIEIQLLVRSDLGIAEPHQVRRNAAPQIAQAVQGMAPMIAVQRHAMDEEGGRPVSFLDTSSLQTNSTRLRPPTTNG